MADPLEETAVKHRLFIFDVEGTLIDCVRPTLICWRDAFAFCGYAFSAEELHRHSRRDPDEMLCTLLPRAEAEGRTGSLLPGALLSGGPAFFRRSSAARAAQAERRADSVGHDMLEGRAR
jgi:beta-phosphoglucomutase-like phosphatase (HAD superfamily)